MWGKGGGWDSRHAPLPHLYILVIKRKEGGGWAEQVNGKKGTLIAMSPESRTEMLGHRSVHLKLTEHWMLTVLEIKFKT